MIFTLVPSFEESRLVIKLLEIPPTIGYFQSTVALCDNIKNFIQKSKLSKLRLLGVLDRLQLLNFHWLSPELATGEQMVMLANGFVKSGHQFLNMSFHSTSMLPGKSPFVKNANELTEILSRIEIFLAYARKNNFEFLPLAKSIEHVDRA
jgi:hypothetical protein